MVFYYYDFLRLCRDQTYTNNTLDNLILLVILLSWLHEIFENDLWSIKLKRITRPTWQCHAFSPFIQWCHWFQLRACTRCRDWNSMRVPCQPCIVKKLFKRNFSSEEAFLSPLKQKKNLKNSSASVTNLIFFFFLASFFRFNLRSIELNNQGIPGLFRQCLGKMFVSMGSHWKNCIFCKFLMTDITSLNHFSDNDSLPFEYLSTPRVFAEFSAKENSARYLSLGRFLNFSQMTWNWCI